MAKLVWDSVGERVYETGVSKAVLYVTEDNGEYGEGVAWNGLTAFTESPSGADMTDLWADGIKYASIRAAEVFGCTIEAYTYPDEYSECDGSAQPVPGLYLGQQKRKIFGFSCRTEVGNDTNGLNDVDRYKLHLVYGASSAPSEKAYSTINDSPDAMTMSWEISTTPVEVPGYKPTASLTIDSTKFDPSKLAMLEEILYGKDAVESVEAVPARLPLPAEVITILTAD